MEAVALLCVAGQGLPVATVVAGDVALLLVAVSVVVLVLQLVDGKQGLARMACLLVLQSVMANGCG